MPVYEKLRYRVVDVFTEHALEGNPLAVFPDASAIDGATMQKIARELNLSETTFVLPAMNPDCAARVRIFTPSKEMLFAGHPTVGTSFVLLDEGIVPKGTGHFLRRKDWRLFHREWKRARDGCLAHYASYS